MKLRWYTEVKKYEKWDSYNDEWCTYELKSDPVLQYFDESMNQWVTVDSFEEVKDFRGKE